MVLKRLTKEDQKNTKWKIIIDVSKSTNGHTKYFETIHTIIDNWKESYQIIFFDHMAYYGEKEDWIKIRDQRRYRSGGTNPSTFLTYLEEGQSIVLFTDGEISSECVRQCDKILQNRYFETVIVHFISTRGAMDLSISAPLTRNVQQYEIFKDEKLLSKGKTREILHSKYVEDVSLFFQDLELIRQSILLRCMGNPQETDRQSILEFKSKIMAKFRQKNQSTPEDSEMIRNELRLSQPSLIKIRQWIEKYSDQEEKMNRVETFFSQILNLCFEQNPNYQFSIFTSFDLRLERNGKSVNPPIQIMPMENQIHSEWECPILLEKDSICIPVIEGIPCLESVSHKELEELWINPLLFLDEKFQWHQERWMERLDVPIGLSCFNQVMEGNRKSAFTRQTIRSAFSFEDHTSHKLSSLYSLQQCLMGPQKLFGNIQLWWIVFWALLKRNKDRWSSILPTVEMFLRRQCSQTMTHIHLSGWVIRPQFSCPTDIALWYCLHSPFFLPEISNRLQVFFRWSSIITDVLETVFHFSVFTEEIEYLVSIYEALYWMKEEKQRNRHWKFHIWGYRQGMILLSDQKTMFPTDGPCERIDGKPCCIDTRRPLPLHDWKKVPLSILYHLIKIIENPTVYYPWTFTLLDWKSIAETIDPMVHFSYQYPKELTVEESMLSIPICESTCRPRIDKDQTWKQCSVSVYGPLQHQLSLYRYFIMFVEKWDRYPITLIEFYEFIYQREWNRFKIWTLPRKIRYFMMQLKKDYRDICAHLSIQEFKTRVRKSQSIQNRLKIQKTCPCCVNFMSQR